MDLNTATIKPVKTSALALVETSPNPFLKELSLTFSASGTYGIVLMDLSGRSIFKKSLIADSGQTLVIRDKVESLPQGIYLLELNHKGEKEVRRLVKVK